MTVFGADLLTPETVQQAFIAAPPLISANILDLTAQVPDFYADVWDLDTWPSGAGTQMQQLIFRGAMPPVERGFDQWRKLGGNPVGCDPAQPPDCSYNWTTLGGHGFDRKVFGLMHRDFRTPTFCVHEIQTTFMFKEVMAKIVENLFRQTRFFKSENIGHNGLSTLSKKFVVDAGGAKFNRENPYVYRPSGGVRLSTLNIEMLEFFYEHLRRIPDAIPYDVVDGSPVYAIGASHQLLSRLYRDNPELRKDIRYSSSANDLLSKYNFLSSIRGMFIASPMLYPRRFNVVSNDWVEVLPFVNNVPAEFGEYTYLNPEYEAATHEEVLIHGKSPFKLYQFPVESSLGSGTSFGPEQSFMNTWDWFNPATPQDPRRREGYFMTEITAGIAPQHSEGLFGILVERPSVALMAMYTPNLVCPVAPPTCDNIVPEVGCPCPMILSITANPLESLQYFFTFNTAVTGEAEDPIQLALDNGAYITGTLVAVSTDGKTASVEFTEELTDSLKAQIIGVYCDANLGCAATVDAASNCRSGVLDAVKLTLSNPIKALDAGDEVLAFFGDCTTAMLEVVSVDLANLQWTVKYAAGYGPTDNPDGSGSPDPTNEPLSADMICDRKGVTKLCVPPATDATCPACDATLTACVEEEEG